MFNYVCIDKRNTNQQIILEFSKNILFIHVVDHIIKKFVFEHYIKNANAYWLITCGILHYFSFSIESPIYTYLYKHFLNTTQQIIKS